MPYLGALESVCLVHDILLQETREPFGDDGMIIIHGVPTKELYSLQRGELHTALKRLIGYTIFGLIDGDDQTGHSWKFKVLSEGFNQRSNVQVERNDGRRLPIFRNEFERSGCRSSVVLYTNGHFLRLRRRSVDCEQSGAKGARV